MDIIRARQETRARMINAIIESIKSKIYKNERVEKKDIVNSTCLSLGISKRTASEYVQLALLSLSKEGLYVDENKNKNLNKY